MGQRKNSADLLSFILAAVICKVEADLSEIGVLKWQSPFLVRSPQRQPDIF